MNRKWVASLLSGLSVFLAAAAAWGETGDDRTLAPFFFVDGGDPSLERFPLKETEVSVTLAGVIAHVTVVQKYANEGERPIHGRYVFPASTRAAVHGMKMAVGENVVTAKIREKETAKREFIRAREEGKSASLLEQQRPNVFTMSVANILPGDEILVELRYTELLVPEEGTYEFVFPAVVGPRYSNLKEGEAAESDRWVKNPYLAEGTETPASFRIGVALSTALPLRDLASPSHRIDVSWQSPSLAEVRLDPSGGFAGNRDFILRYRLSGEAIQSGLLLFEGASEKFFLLMVEPPERAAAEDIPGREYVFLLDVSGSMHGFPLDTAKRLMKDLIGNLRETDRFNVVLFSGASAALAPRSLPATGENVEGAVRFVESQQGGGGTELAPALERALSLPREPDTARSVIVVSDGYIAVEREIFEIIRRNLEGTNFFSFGIGSGVNRYLMEGIARAGAGEPFIVTNPREAGPAAERFRKYVASPLLVNTAVEFRGFDARDIEPPGLPDLFAARPLVLFGKWRGERKGEIVLSGKGPAGPFLRVFPVAETTPLPENGGLPYLWARARIARLSDYGEGGRDGVNRLEITGLGLSWNLLTAYTSFVAVLETVRNPGAAAVPVDQPLPLPLHVSNLAVGNFSAVSEPGFALLAAFVLLWVLLVVFYRYCRDPFWRGKPWKRTHR
jgi:Ca-activated chloride channel family protein